MAFKIYGLSIYGMRSKMVCMICEYTFRTPTNKNAMQEKYSRQWTNVCFYDLIYVFVLCKICAKPSIQQECKSFP